MRLPWLIVPLIALALAVTWTDEVHGPRGLTLTDHRAPFQLPLTRSGRGVLFDDLWVG
jgi:hypothetical protein